MHLTALQKSGQPCTMNVGRVRQSEIWCSFAFFIALSKHVIARACSEFLLCVEISGVTRDFDNISSNV